MEVWKEVVRRMERERGRWTAEKMQTRAERHGKKKTVMDREREASGWRDTFRQSDVTRFLSTGRSEPGGGPVHMERVILSVCLLCFLGLVPPCRCMPFTPEQQKHNSAFKVHKRTIHLGVKTRQDNPHPLPAHASVLSLGFSIIDKFYLACYAEFSLGRHAKFYLARHAKLHLACYAKFSRTPR